MYCLETIDLTHKFSESETALDRVNLRVAEGSIYGFLGPNGAGKTTTLKLVLGLLKKQAGDIRVFGRSFKENRIEILGKLGSLIESPSLYGHLTATENLKILQTVYRCPASRIGEVLSMVGLSHTGSKKTGQFSLGMKQRLSIAMALLPNPSLLILDEPTNGLDPNGILEIREFLQRLNREQGITIVISSHLLAEIEKLVTHIGIINHGKMLFQGTLPELIEKQHENSYIVFETSDDAQTAAVIRAGGTELKTGNAAIAIPVIEKAKVANINRELVQRGIEVYQISTVNRDLEAIFFDVIKD